MLALTLEDLEPYEGRTAQELSPGGAIQLVDLFRGLEWWLDPAVLERARSSPFAETWLDAGRLRDPIPRLPETQGCAVVVAAVDPRFARDYPILKPGLLFPFEWVTGEAASRGHDPRLPGNLHTLADRIRQQVEDPEKRKWCLRLGPVAGLDRDISGLPLEWDSGWASLAAALHLAVRGGESRADVWASATWTDEGIGRVDGLEAKLRSAIDFGARVFFVHKSLVGDARAMVTGPAGPVVEIEALRSPTLDIEEAIRPLLDRLGIEPGPDAPRDRRTRWYLGLRDRGAKDRYYYSHLFEEIVMECRAKLRAAGEDFRPRLLVTVQSTSAASIVGASVLDPERCLLLHTPDQGDVLRRWKLDEPRFRERFPGARLMNWELQSTESIVDQIIEVASRHTAGIPGEEVAFDLTSGSSLMKLGLLQAAPSGSRLVCIEHSFDERARQPEPFTERVRSLRVHQALRLG